MCDTACSAEISHTVSTHSQLYHERKISSRRSLLLLCAEHLDRAWPASMRLTLLVLICRLQLLRRLRPPVIRDHPAQSDVGRCLTAPSEVNKANYAAQRNVHTTSEPSRRFGSQRRSSTMADTSFKDVQVTKVEVGRAESLATFRELGPPDLCHVVSVRSRLL
ncbi:hypothetical protein BDN67DRAFT_690501 [Paxillus ammoniavirescens]|nr:hypothetical protein BDN67DRAFT_690501 [Paxillus ammoniavirescens]